MNMEIGVHDFLDINAPAQGKIGIDTRSLQVHISNSTAQVASFTANAFIEFIWLKKKL